MLRVFGTDTCYSSWHINDYFDIERTACLLFIVLGVQSAQCALFGVVMIDLLGCVCLSLVQTLLFAA